MQVSLFDFTLPEKLIALHPAEPRGASRMLVVEPDSQRFTDSAIKALPAWLKPGDLLVLNDTRVIPARLFGVKGNAAIEIVLHKHLSGSRWEVFARPAKKLERGDVIAFAPDFMANVLAKTPDGQVVVAFNAQAETLNEMLRQYGQMPLPPYIQKKRAASQKDKAAYQTIFAREEGAVAAPTAGLHFSEALFAELEAHGVRKTFITLHVGAGTFQSVKAEDTANHVMHSERAHITPETAAIINETRAKGGRIVAIGTTSLRTLESATDDAGVTHSFHADTDIFITPGYRFKCVDILLTNFHLPRSTLFMLVCAFSGMKQMKTAYEHAIHNNYGFYSYGDACLLFRAPQ